MTIEAQAVGKETRAANRAAFKEPEEAANDLSKLQEEEEKIAEAEIEARTRRYSQAMASRWRLHS